MSMENVKWGREIVKSIDIARCHDKHAAYYFLGGKTAEELEKAFAEIILELRNDGGSNRYNCRINIAQM